VLLFCAALLPLVVVYYINTTAFLILGGAYAGIVAKTISEDWKK